MSHLSVLIPAKINNNLSYSKEVLQAFQRKNPDQMSIFEDFSNCYIIDGLRVAPYTHEVILENSDRLKFRKKEFQLLMFFLLNQNKVINRYSLLDLIWNYDLNAKSNTLEAHLSMLRNKIRKHLPQLHIKTIHGLGYQMINQKNTFN